MQLHRWKPANESFFSASEVVLLIIVVDDSGKILSQISAPGTLKVHQRFTDVLNMIKRTMQRKPEPMSLSTCLSAATAELLWDKTGQLQRRPPVSDPSEQSAGKKYEPSSTPLAKVRILEKTTSQYPKVLLARTSIQPKSLSFPLRRTSVLLGRWLSHAPARPSSNATTISLGAHDYFRVMPDQASSMLSTQGSPAHIISVLASRV